MARSVGDTGRHYYVANGIRFMLRKILMLFARFSKRPQEALHFVIVSGDLNADRVV